MPRFANLIASSQAKRFKMKNLLEKAKDWASSLLIDVIDDVATGVSSVVSHAEDVSLGALGAIAARLIPSIRRQNAIVEAIALLSGPDSVAALEKIARQNPEALRGALPKSRGFRYRKTGAFSKAASGRTPLGLAVICKNEEAALFLIPLSDVSAEDDSGVQALAIAARHGEPALVSALLAAGAAVNHADKKGRTALMEAAHNGRVENTQLLVRSGQCDLGQVDEAGNSALSEACDGPCLADMWPHASEAARKAAAEKSRRNLLAAAHNQAAGFPAIFGMLPGGMFSFAKDCTWENIDLLESHWPEEHSARAFELAGQDPNKMPKRAARLEAAALRAEIATVDMAAQTTSAEKTGLAENKTEEKSAVCKNDRASRRAPRI